MFVAVDLPAAIKDVAGNLAERLRVSTPPARWVPRDNYHLTTKFLGNVPDERVADVARAASHAAAGMVTFEVGVGPLGAFPSPRRARVIWLGLDDPAGGFAALAVACDEGFEPLGFAPEARAFTPHLTLARLRVPAPVDLPHLEPVEARFAVDRVALFRSHLGRPSARYEALAVYPFGLSG